MSEISIKSERLSETDELNDAAAAVPQLFVNNYSEETGARRDDSNNSMSLLKVMASGNGNGAHYNRNKPGHAASKLPVNGNRCGEIFVTNNARKWTFICSYCEKRTSDIGEFVCHITKRHLDAQQYNSDDDEEQTIRHGSSCNESALNDANNYNHDDNDCLDYNNYLQVNVMTDAENASFNGNTTIPTSTQDLSSQQQTLPTLTPIMPVMLSHSQDNTTKENKHKNHKKNQKEIAISIAKKFRSMNGMEKATDWHNANFEQNKATYCKAENESLNDCQLNRQSDNEEQQHDTEDDEEYERSYADDNDDDYDEDEDANKLLHTPEELQAAADDIDPSKIISENYKKSRQIRGPAYCNLCNKTFQYYSLYRNHMLKHSNETPFACIICQKGFKSKQALRYHLHTHQRERRFRCKLCQAGFHTESLFMTHMQTHENANTHACLVCAKLFSTSQERDLHMECHNSERPWRCNYCHKLFRLRHHLSNHIKTHKQYRCDFCRKEFTSFVHMRKPYACSECENLPDVKPQLEQTKTHANQLAGDGTNEMLQNDTGAESTDDNCTSSYQNMSKADDDSMYDENMSDMAANNDFNAMGGRPRLNCNYCQNSYSHRSGLNFHIRSKHWNINLSKQQQQQNIDC